VAVSAKVVCTGTSPEGEGDERHAQVSFGPDYSDGRNAEWAHYTPHLSLEMTVAGKVVDQFRAGQRWDLIFQRRDDDG
jgi:hypothetical protein